MARANLRATTTHTAIKSKPAYAVRPITCSTKLYKEDKRSPSERQIQESDHSHAGSFSRTDNRVAIEYPGEDKEPTSTPVQGRGGMHFKRTLASFSLEGRVGIVTGGARGLGLVMSQALVISGCDVAIVDLNSTSCSCLYDYPCAILIPATRGRRRPPGKGPHGSFLA